MENVLGVILYGIPEMSRVFLYQIIDYKFAIFRANDLVDFVQDAVRLESSIAPANLNLYFEAYLDFTSRPLRPVAHIILHIPPHSYCTAKCELWSTRCDAITSSAGHSLKIGLL